MTEPLFPRLLSFKNNGSSIKLPGYTFYHSNPKHLGPGKSFIHHLQSASQNGVFGTCVAIISASRIASCLCNCKASCGASTTRGTRREAPIIASTSFSAPWSSAMMASPAGGKSPLLFSPRLSLQRGQTNMWKKGHPVQVTSRKTRTWEIGWLNDIGHGSVSIGLELNVWILQSPKYNHEWRIEQKKQQTICLL